MAMVTGQDRPVIRGADRSLVILEGGGTMKHVKVMGFDLDGTLVKIKLDFRTIRKELGIPDGDILSYISSLPRPQGEKLLRAVEKREMEAAEKAEIMEGAQELLEHCRSRDIRVVVITRNSEKASKRTLSKLDLEVDMVISREHSAPKPSPEPLNMVLGHFEIEPYQMAFVGDYLFDMQAGRAAGVKTILLTTQESCDQWTHAADFVVTDLYEVLDLLKEGREAKCNVR